MPTSSEPAIEAEGLSKCYRLGRPTERGYRTLRDALAGGFRRRARVDLLWALRDVSFTLREGEALGVVGPNGAGKSTLLKLLARITEPSSGRARLRGRVASLLEVGTGFHPELTGRENVFLNGAMLGMTRAEIRARFDAMVAFAGVEAFLDTPVKRYSSGMYVRLAFAVAAHLTPEILIVDEVLAVGDHEFQRRCLGRMHAVAHSGRSVLFVSHNLRAVEELCDRSLLLRGGRLERCGPTGEVLAHYLARRAQEVQSSEPGAWDLGPVSDREGTGRARLTRLELWAEERDELLARLPFGRPFRLRLHYAGPAAVPGAVAGFALLGESQRRLFLSASDEGPPAPLGRAGLIECRVQAPNVLPGRYSFEVWLTDPELQNYADHLSGVGALEVLPEAGHGPGASGLARRDRGVVYVPCSWSARA